MVNFLAKSFPLPYAAQWLHHACVCQRLCRLGSDGERGKFWKGAARIYFTIKVWIPIGGRTAQIAFYSLPIFLSLGITGVEIPHSHFFIFWPIEIYLACAEWWVNITLFYEIEWALSKRDEMCCIYCTQFPMAAGWLDQLKVTTFNSTWTRVKNVRLATSCHFLCK